MSNNNIINFYDTKEVKKTCRKYDNPSFEQCQIKHPAMIACIGSTGSGKTQLLLNLIYQMSDTFTKIIIVHKVNEPLYDYLAKQLKDDIIFYKKLSDVPSPDDLVKEDPCGQYLMVFDDQITAKDMNIIGEYYIRGRKSGGSITSVFLSQSYYGIPKLIRLQLHYLILLKLSGVRDLNMILSDNNLGVDKKELMKMYKVSTKDKFNFLKLDLANSDENKKYSHNWTEFFIVKSIF